MPSFPEDLPDDFKLETTDQNQIAFPPQMATIVAGSGYPEPTLVPGKEGGKLKTVYKCEKCSKYKKVWKTKEYISFRIDGHFFFRQVISKKETILQSQI